MLVGESPLFEGAVVETLTNPKDIQHRFFLRAVRVELEGMSSLCFHLCLFSGILLAGTSTYTIVATIKESTDEQKLPK